MSDFFKHAFTMMRGIVLAQAIPIVLLPLISRLYSPDDYGLFASVLSVATFLSVAFGFRLEMAVVLPKDDKEALRVASTTATLIIGLSSVAIAGFVLINSVLSNPMPWLYLAAPFLGGVAAFMQLCIFMANRERDYAAISTGIMGNQLSNALSAIALGFLKTRLWGLLIARHLGQLANIGRLSQHARQICRQGLASLKTIRSVISDYRKFPLYTLPYSLIGSLSREFLVLVLVAFHAPSAAGLYAMARSVLLVPSNLLAASMSQVFYKECIEHGTDKHFQCFTYRLFLITGAMGAMGFAFVALWNADLFALVLGDRWAYTGPYAILMAPVGLLAAMTSWPERIFEVRGKQNWSFYLQVVLDGIMILIVMIMLVYGATPLQAVAIYAGFMSVYYLLYMGLVFRLSNLKFTQYLALLALMTSGIGVVFALHGILKSFFEQNLLLLLAEGGLIAVFCLAGMWTGMKTAGIRLKEDHEFVSAERENDIL